MIRTILITIFTLLLAVPAHAMHIAEGILPLPWALAWSALAVPFVVLGVRHVYKLARQEPAVKPLIGLLAAAVFIISAMPLPVPTAGTCSHPCGTGLAAILLGPWISSLIAAVTLLLQALFLGHGGISTWGANIVAMGVIGSLAGFMTFKGLRAMGASLGLAAFFAGLQADWATYMITSVALASGVRGSEPFLPLLEKILLAFVPTQLPIGILEGVLTAAMVLLLARKRPDILVKLRVLTPGEVKTHGS